jgi:hypothetical protein
MTARRVHALLAAGLQKPALIAAWRANPELLAADGAKFNGRHSMACASSPGWAQRYATTACAKRYRTASG